MPKGEECYSVVQSIQDSLNDLKDSRITGESALTKIAATTQGSGLVLVQEGVMPLRNALVIQASTFRYTGRWEESLKAHFSENDIAVLGQRHQDYQESLRTQRF